MSEKDSLENKDVLDNEDDKELDELLNGEKPEEKDDKEPENKKEEKQTYKLGTQEFDTFEEFNKAVQDMHSRNAKMASKIGELGYDPKTLTPKQKEEVKKAVEKDEKEEKKVEKKEFDESDYYKFESMRFQRKFPESKNYKDEMSILIKKDNCKINGEPSYALAFARALAANGEEIPEKLKGMIRAERGESSESDKAPVKPQKKIMRSGGQSSQAQSGDYQETYDEESFENLQSFTKNL